MGEPAQSGSKSRQPKGSRGAARDDSASDEESETSSEESEDENAKKKGVAGVIEIENPNKAKTNYQKMHAAGKTDEARADLARLAIIRKQREEAAAKREAEKKAKEDAAKAKADAKKSTR